MTRLNIEKLEPVAYKAMLGLENYLSKCGLDKVCLGLIKIRASQINGCAFCINMHTQEAMKQGETAQRIFMLNAWRETNLYSVQEQVILAMTEEITHISIDGWSDGTYKKAKEIFDDHIIAQVIIAISTINAWNRIAVSSRTQIQ